MPIITVPIKIQLTGAGLGPTCFIGSEQNPIVLHPANTSLAGLSLAIDIFDPDGTPDPNGPIGAIVLNGLIQGDSTFAVPGASGCTDDNTVNALLGLPSPSGANNVVLLDASSAVALPIARPERYPVVRPSGIPRSGAPPDEHDHDNDQHHDHHDLSHTGLAGWGARPPPGVYSPL